MKTLLSKLKTRRDAHSGVAGAQPARADVAIIFDNASDEAVYAMRGQDGAILSERCPVARLPEAVSRAFERAGIPHAGRDSAGADAQFLTCANFFTEESRTLQLPKEIVALDGERLTLAVADAAENNYAGEDEQLLIPDTANAADRVWDIARTPSGKFTITSVDSAALDGAAHSIASSALGFDAAADNAEELYLEFRCETLARAVLRAYLTDLNSSRPSELERDESKVTALVVVNPGGASVALWSPVRGLFLEEAEPFKLGDGQFDADLLQSSVEHALENLALRLAPSSIDQFGFRGVQRVLWSCSPKIRSVVSLQIRIFADDYEAQYSRADFQHPADLPLEQDDVLADDGSIRLETQELSLPLEEMATQGLLLASTLPAANLIAPINLAYPPLQAAADIKFAQEEKRVVEQLTTRRRVQIAALVPLIIAFGLIFGGYLITLVESYRLDAALTVEQQEQARLAPVAARRKSATDVLSWVSAYLNQVTELRRRQPAPLSLLAALDERYPVSEDDSFTVKLLSASADGEIQIQGLTKREEAVSALINKLEYSPTDSQGKKLFQNPKYELRQPQVGGINLPQIPGAQGAASNTSALQTVQSQRPDVTAWTVRFTYTPLQRDSAVAAKPTPKPASTGGSQPPPAVK